MPQLLLESLIKLSAHIIQSVGLGPVQVKQMLLHVKQVWAELW